MPTVRRLNRQVQTQALPGARLTAADTAESLGAGEARARAGAAGNMAASIGNVAGQALRYSNEAVARERQRANEVALLEATNKLDTWELENLYNPQTGALNTRGKAAFDLPEKLDDGFRKATATIEEGLGTDEQRIAFEKVKAQRGANVALAVRRHVAGEMQRFDESELGNTLKNSANLAAANALDPRRVGEEMARGEDAIIAHANRYGVGPETYEAQLEAFRSGAHIGVINNLMASGHERAAQVYYEEKEKEIAGTQRDQVLAAIQAGTTAKQGRVTADDIWNTLGPKGDLEPIHLDKMEDEARKRFPDDEKALKATMQNLRERKAAADASRQDRKEQTAGALWGAVAQGRTLAQVQAMPEYRSAPGQLQAQISEHIVDQAEQAANRAYTRGQRAEAALNRSENAKERAGWAEMWRLEDPKVLSTMNDNQILGLIPTLGVDHVNRLMTKRRALAAGAEKVHAATIDDDLFKTTAQAAGLNAYDAKTADEKSDLGQLRNAVETAIDAEQQQTGKALTRERKQQIMREMTDRRVMLNTWGRDPERIAATVVNSDDRTKAYVPLAKVPPAALSQYLNYLRSVSPAAQGMTDQQMRERFEDRIQRAYGRRMIGGSRAEIESILTGQD